MTLHETIADAIAEAATLEARSEVRQIARDSFVACALGETLIGRLVWESPWEQQQRENVA